MSEARVIQIRPLNPTVAPIWDMADSDYPDRIKLPMEDGHIITYYREAVEQPRPHVILAERLRKMIQDNTYGYPKSETK